MALQIIFPEQPPQLEFHRDCLAFPAVMGTKTYKCLATLELLMERFHAQSGAEEELLRAYQEHKDELRAIARSQILAGNVGLNGDVLLTTDTFGLKGVIFSEKLRETRALFVLGRRATQQLEDVLGQSASQVNAEWDRAEDDQGRPVVTLRLSDWTGAVTGVFAPQELEHHRHLGSRLQRLWGDLLQVRSHRQLEELQEASASAEA